MAGGTNGVVQVEGVTEDEHVVLNAYEGDYVPRCEPRVLL